jgi:hypothetical protein
VFESTWHRANRPGWQLWLYRMLSLGWGALVVYSLAYTSTLEADAYTVWVSVVYWIALVWAGLVLWRMQCIGVFVGPEGVRLEWLARQRTLAWDEVAAIQVVDAPISLRGRVHRAVIVTTRGETVPVQGSDEIMRWIFHADSPEMVRHRLERERRFFLGQALPQRQPQHRSRPSDAIIDLRDAAARRAQSPSIHEARAAGA